MNQHDRKVYREGYNNGKSKARIVRTTLVQRIQSTDEKEWENKINWFAWTAIICLLLFGITAELYAHNWNTTNECNTKLAEQKNSTVNCWITEQQCETARIRESISRPTITQIEATIYHYEDGPGAGE